MLLDVQDLHAERATRDTEGRERVARVLNGASFRLVKGRVLALVGEQQSGKSLTASAILGLLQPPAQVVRGRALFEGQDLLRMSDTDLARLRGARIGLVVQSARNTLDPTMRIGTQLTRAQGVHRHAPRAEAAWRAETIMSSMGIPDARGCAQAWPDDLSPGMVQRVVIALALINEPQLLIADEPTAGLDITTQLQILDLLHVELRRRRIGGLIITRDLGVAAQYCDDVAVMYAGQVVEQGPVAQVFARPAHPFTRTLLAATPERLSLGQQPVAEGASTGARAQGFSGPPPDLFALPQGCLYRDRCHQAEARCDTPPPLVGSGVHAARCHFAGTSAPQRAA